MKKEFTGWVGKTEKSVLSEKVFENCGKYFSIEDFVIWKTRGKKDTWDYKDWPPKKVKITIEIEEL